MREHADLLEALMRAPDDKRDFRLHRHPHGKNAVPRQRVPMKAAAFLECGPHDPLHKVGRQRQGDDIAAERGAQPNYVVEAGARIIVTIVGNEQRV